MSETPVFHARKKRKITTPLWEYQPSPVEALKSEAAPKRIDTDTGSDDEQPVSKLVKRPAARKPGVTFNAARRAIDIPTPECASQTVVEPDQVRVPHMPSRFVTPGQGQAVDIDKHMLAYIDSHISHKHETYLPDQRTFRVPTSDSSNDATNQDQPCQAESQPLNPYQLSEVTLPPPPPPKSPPRPKVRKPRLGRDGKPLPPRQPRRRPSDDIARDALVERLLSEHRLAESSLPTGTSLPRTHSSGGSTRDVAFAEKFKAELMEQATERQSRDEAKKTQQVKEASIGTGPKLGGSRTDRAKMQAAQQSSVGKGGGTPK